MPMAPLEPTANSGHWQMKLRVIDCFGHKSGQPLNPFSWTSSTSDTPQQFRAVYCMWNFTYTDPNRPFPKATVLITAFIKSGIRDAILFPMPSKPLCIHELHVKTRKTIRLDHNDLRDLNVDSSLYGERD